MGTIAKINGIAWASVAKRNGVVVASIAKISGMDKPVAGYLFEENFTTGAAPAGWSTIGGAPDYAYATAPAPLRGSYSLRCAVGDTVESAAFTAQSTAYAHLLLNYDATPAASSYVFYLYGGATQLARIRPTSTAGTVTFYHGTASASTTGWTAGVTYHIWLKYIAGTGADGVLEIYRSTTTTKPGSPLATITTGTSTGSVDRIRCLGALTINPIFDQIIVHSAEIGDVAA